MATEKQDVLELAELAFIGDARGPNMSARGRLVNLIGAANAAAIGKSYGIFDIGRNYKTRGVRPAETTFLDEMIEEYNLAKATAANQPPTKIARLSQSPTNPWSGHKDNIDAFGNWNVAALKRQQSILKTNIKLAAEIAASAGSFVGATVPPKPPKNAA